MDVEPGIVLTTCDIAEETGGSHEKGLFYKS